MSFSRRTKIGKGALKLSGSSSLLSTPGESDLVKLVAAGDQDDMGVKIQLGIDVTNLATGMGTLGSDINTNASEITTNAGDISTNAGGVATNAGGISSNAGDIAVNAGAIGALTGTVGAGVNWKAPVDNLSAFAALEDSLQVGDVVIIKDQLDAFLRVADGTGEDLSGLFASGTYDTDYIRFMDSNEIASANVAQDGNIAANAAAITSLASSAATATGDARSTLLEYIRLHAMGSIWFDKDDVGSGTAEFIIDSTPPSALTALDAGVTPELMPMSVDVYIDGLQLHSADWTYVPRTLSDPDKLTFVFGNVLADSDVRVRAMWDVQNYFV